VLKRPEDNVRNVRGTRHSLPNTRKLTIIAQDPSVRVGQKILTTEVEIPAEDLLPGPRGYRVIVIDYDTAAGTLYKPATFKALRNGAYHDPFANKSDTVLLSDPRFHAQNVYAIVMRTLARFEFALGRRVAWGSQGHQLHIAPHAFSEANAYYSRDDRGLFFGYFLGASNKPVYTCLSHDIIAHETTHAILDGLRARYMEPSSPDQAAFHEGFSDVIALLSVFSLKDVVGALLGRGLGNKRLISEARLERDALKKSVLLGLADEMGSELSAVRGEALRRSVELNPSKAHMTSPAYKEEHERGELLVAALLNAFLDIWLERLAKIGSIEGNKKDRSLVVEEGARVAEHLLTMAIRAIDYCPPTDITFSDYLSALLTIDREVVPDDDKYGYRKAILRNFNAFGIEQAKGAGKDGTWRRCDQEFVYSRTRFDSMLRNKEEVFRFIWENRKQLKIHKDGYVEVQSVQPSHRIGPDGFILRETIAEYVQILTLYARELKSVLGITPPRGLNPWRRVRVFGGGALVFNEYGQLKYQIANRLEDRKRQKARLNFLFDSGFFDRPPEPRPPGSQSRLAQLHLARATS
jgi:hypothetical protein